MTIDRPLVEQSYACRVCGETIVRSYSGESCETIHALPLCEQWRRSRGECVDRPFRERIEL